MTLKYQVFISSTYSDLIEERKALIQELLNLGCIPAAMEYFQPIDKSLAIIKSFLDNCDYVVLIIGGRYGSIINRKSNNISYTEAEFKYAKKKKIPIIPFLLEENTLNVLRKSKRKADQKKTEKTIDGQRRLKRFRKQLMKEQLVQFYKSEKDLPLLLANAFNEAKLRKPRPGWIREKQGSRQDIIYSAIEKNLLRQIQHNEILPLFHKANGISAKIKKAFPLTKRLVGKSKRKAEEILQQTNTTIIRNAKASGIYRRNMATNAIELNPVWISYQLVYAICHVLDNRLHSQGRFGENSFSKLNWWKSPWDNIILYISQICSDEGFDHTVKILLRDATEHNEKVKAECHELIYRMLILRPFVKMELLDRVTREILSFSSKDYRK